MACMSVNEARRNYGNEPVDPSTTRPEGLGLPPTRDMSTSSCRVAQAESAPPNGSKRILRIKGRFAPLSFSQWYENNS